MTETSDAARYHWSAAAIEEREFAATTMAPFYTAVTKEGARAILDAARELGDWSADGRRRLLGKLDRDTRRLYVGLLASQGVWDNGEDR